MLSRERKKSDGVKMVGEMPSTFSRPEFVTVSQQILFGELWTFFKGFIGHLIELSEIR